MMRAVKLLKRVLLLQAAAWAACGAAVAIAPRFVLVTLFDLAGYPEFGYVRVAGVLAFSLALLMVLVAQRLIELWWFSWAFVLAAAGTAVVAILTAIFSVPEGSSSLLWWVFAGMSALFTAGLLAGLAKAGVERSPQ